MNNLYNQLMQQQSLSQKSLPSLKNNLEVLKKTMGNYSDPNSFIQNVLLNKNPQLKNVMQALQSSNMTPKQFFYQYAQQMGVDPNQFLNS